MGLKKFFNVRRAKKFRAHHKIGLCLSGGGTRGFAYIGVFKALIENGIEFDMISGCSAGSLFGALYASGASYEEMYKCITEIKSTDFRNAKFGVLPSSMDSLKQAVKKYIKVKRIEDLQTPFYCNAVNLKTGSEIIFDTGDIASAVTASSAMPLAYLPVTYKNMTLIDGGVKNNIPADILRDHGCDYIVTVDCNANRGQGTNSEKFMSQLLASVDIMMVNNSSLGLSLSDIIISPNLARFSPAKMDGKEEMILEGYRATMKAMPKIKKLFSGEFKK